MGFNLAFKGLNSVSYTLVYYGGDSQFEDTYKFSVQPSQELMRQPEKSWQLNN